MKRKRKIAGKIDVLWRQVEWDWYRQSGQNVLYWHWSPNHGWAINHAIRGYDEALIVYVLAASSPTHSIPAEVYHQKAGPGEGTSMPVLQPMVTILPSGIMVPNSTADRFSGRTIRISDWIREILRISTPTTGSTM
jgi:hypothetical protein